MLFKHWSEVPWDKDRWPNFSAGEKHLACPCCGEYYLDYGMQDKLQSVRNILGCSVHVNSGHRCRRHNMHVGGAAQSSHLLVAWDISLRGHSPEDLYAAAVAAGFTTFGHYRTFLHVDPRPGRRWFTKAGRETWRFLVK